MKQEFRFYVYVMSNYRRTSFYIGFSNNIIRRIIEHKNGFGSGFTKKYKLTDLVYCEFFQYVYDAINREKELKKWRREKKLILIKSLNPELKDLSQKFFTDYGISKRSVLGMAEELKNRYGV